MLHFVFLATLTAMSVADLTATPVAPGLVEYVARSSITLVAARIDASSAAELMQRSPAGQTILHVLLFMPFSTKAGEVSRLETWTDPARTTRYRHAIHNRIAQPLLPVIRAALAKAPQLANMADGHGVMPLHVSALVGIQGATRLLLAAGASPLARNALGRTPIDDAMQQGQIEILIALLAALPAAERRAQEDLAAEYASLPGAPLLPRLLQTAGLSHSPRARARLDQPPRERQSAERKSKSKSAPACAEGGGWDVAPPPSEAARLGCDIDQRDASLSAEEYKREYFDKSLPVLLRGAVPLAQRCGLAKGVGPMRRTEVVKQPCGRTAYPSLTGQSHCGAFSFLDLDRHPVCSDAEGTLPICVSKPRSNGINDSSSVWSTLPVGFRYTAGSAPTPLLQPAWLNAGAHQLFAGGNGSGAALHFHNFAYNVLFFGVKHWLITPPRFAGISGAPSSLWRDEHAPRDLPAGAGMPLRCTQGPGDMVIMPSHWGHATINEAFSIGVGDLFCDTRLGLYMDSAQCSAPFKKLKGPSQAERISGLFEAISGAPGRPTRAPGSSARPPHAKRSWESGARPGSAQDSASGAVELRGKPGARGHSVRNRRLSLHAPPREGDGQARQPPSSSAASRAGVATPMRRPLVQGCAQGGANFTCVGFVHVNKAGGTAMRAALLFNAAHQMLERLVPKATAQLRTVGARFFHASASLQRWAVGQAEWSRSYTFALVRNPWSRQVPRKPAALRNRSAARPTGAPAGLGSWLGPLARVTTRAAPPRAGLNVPLFAERGGVQADAAAGALQGALPPAGRSVAR